MKKMGRIELLFDVEVNEEITIHCGYNDFQGKLIEISLQNRTIKLEEGKNIIEIKIKDIYAITKSTKTRR